MPQHQTAWQRSRRRLIVHPPKFVAMTDEDEVKIVDAIVALLIAHLGNNATGGRSDSA